MELPAITPELIVVILLTLGYVLWRWKKAKRKRPLNFDLIVDILIHLFAVVIVLARAISLIMLGMPQVISIDTIQKIDALHVIAELLLMKWAFSEFKKSLDSTLIEPKEVKSSKQVL